MFEFLEREREKREVSLFWKGGGFEEGGLLGKVLRGILNSPAGDGSILTSPF